MVALASNLRDTAKWPILHFRRKSLEQPYNLREKTVTHNNKMVLRISVFRPFLNKINKNLINR